MATIPPSPTDPPPADGTRTPTGTSGRAGWRSGDLARGALIALGVWLALQLLWTVNALVFVVFLGVLFGVAVASGVDVLERRGIRRGVASALLVFGTVGAVALVFALLAPTLGRQAQELRRDLPEAVGKVQALINQREFGFLDPFLRAPEDAEPDSARASDSTARRTATDSVPRRRPATPPAVAPTPPEIDTAAVASLQSITKAIGDTLRDRLIRPPSPDSGLFEPRGPFLARPDQDTTTPSVGVLGDTTSNVMDADAQLEARTRFLRDSLRRALAATAARDIAAAERRAREELLASGVIAGPPPPTRSEMLARRLSSGLAGSSAQLFSFASGTIAALGGLIMIMFLAIYIGAEPDVYRRWVLSVVPAEHRGTVQHVLAGMGSVLRKWLVTQLIAMLVIGVVSTVTLLLFDVRAAFALGFIAGLLEFVPTVGPVLAALPAMAMALVDSPQKALAIMVAYWAIQFVENNLLIPALMRGEMDLPPAITLVAQALMALLFGFLGLMVAVPLTAAVLVPIRHYAARQDARARESMAGEPRVAHAAGGE